MKNHQDLNAACHKSFLLRQMSNKERPRALDLTSQDHLSPTEAGVDRQKKTSWRHVSEETIKCLSACVCQFKRTALKTEFLILAWYSLVCYISQ